MARHARPNRGRGAGTRSPVAPPRGSAGQHPDIAWWWAPIDRENQLWLPQNDSFICPEEVWELRPRAKPDPFERYTHTPNPRITTSELRGNLSSELAGVLRGNGDWILEFPINLRKTRIRTNARVREITSAQDWHDLVRDFPADGAHATHPDLKGVPWGNSDGMVPDWSRVGREWDGVHVTPWALLTATQVRVTSEIGWTEAWAWEGAHTLWLDWMFDAVIDLPPLEERAVDAPHYFMPRALCFNDSESPGFSAINRDGNANRIERGTYVEPFGNVDGQPVEKITLANDSGMTVSILNYGGIIQSLRVPDRDGAFDNVVLGFDNLDDYVEKSPYFGAIVGRYANRIARGQFVLNGDHVPGSREQRPELAARRPQRVRQARLGCAVNTRPDATELVLTRHQPRWRRRLSGRPRRPGYLQLSNDNSLSIDYKPRRGDNRAQPFQPQLLQPGGGGKRARSCAMHVSSPPATTRRSMHR